MIELGLIGKPLGHSSSPSIFNEIFRREGVEGSYGLFPLQSISELTGLLEEHPGLKGLNVTIPYKREVISYLNEISPEARAIGAVNTVLVDHRDGALWLKGFNTDCYGFGDSLSQLDPGKIGNCLLLGSGGAAQAVAYALDMLGVGFSVVSRSGECECMMAGKNRDVIAYSDLDREVMQSTTLIVNATPAGMWPATSEAPRLPYHLLHSRHILYDLVYNPGLTEFLKRGVEKGCMVKNGLDMLRLQAMKAWEIWNGTIR